MGFLMAFAIVLVLAGIFLVSGFPEAEMPLEKLKILPNPSCNVNSANGEIQEVKSGGASTS